jgi:hypothetical protein
MLQKTSRTVGVIYYVYRTYNWNPRLIHRRPVLTLFLPLNGMSPSAFLGTLVQKTKLLNYWGSWMARGRRCFYPPHWHVAASAVFDCKHWGMPWARYTFLETGFPSMSIQTSKWIMNPGLIAVVSDIMVINNHVLLGWSIVGYITK